MINFLLTIMVLSWVFWLPAAILGLSAATVPGKVLLYLGGLGPLFATLIWLRKGSRSERIAYGRRLTAWRGLISPAGLMAVGLPFAFGMAAALAPGGIDPLPTTAWVSLAIPLLLFGPLPEELAWRGVALPGLLRTRSPLAASLFLGLVWAIWHLPLFFIPATYQAGLSASPLAVGMYLGVLPLQSIIYTLIWVGTQGSTLSAILYHWLTNLTGEVLNIQPGGEVFRFAAITLVAVAAGAWLQRVMPAPGFFDEAGAGDPDTPG